MRRLKIISVLSLIASIVCVGMFIREKNLYLEKIGYYNEPNYSIEQNNPSSEPNNQIVVYEKGEEPADIGIVYEIAAIVFLLISIGTFSTQRFYLKKSK